jgi:hypothetical protein
MRHNVHKGLQDIRTRGSLTSDAENPQRKFLRLASLELKKSLCRKVRDAARKPNSMSNKRNFWRRVKSRSPGNWNWIWVLLPPSVQQETLDRQSGAASR